MTLRDEVAVLILLACDTIVRRTQSSRAQAAPGILPGQEKEGKRMAQKKDYEKPSIIHTEKLEGRAAVCSGKGDEASCPGGPIQS